MSVINNRLHHFNLKFLKNVTVSFNPLQSHKSVTRAREFLRIVQGDKLKITNPDCSINTEIRTCDQPAYVEFTYINNIKESIWFNKKLEYLMSEIYLHQAHVIQMNDLTTQIKPTDQDDEWHEELTHAIKL